MSKTRSELDRKERSRLTKDEWREYTKTVWQIANVVHPDHPAVFPEEVPTRLVKMFTFVGESVLDPFAGTGITAVAALRLGRHAIIVDQSRKYIEIARRATKRLCTSEARLISKTADSRRMPWIESDSVGLVVTSPPYWNKADYGDGLANLGNTEPYLEFVQSLRPVFEECYRVLMAGRKVCVVTANVNQHTDHGLLSFPLAADMTMLLRDIGFMMINEIIWNKDGTGGKWGSWGKQRPIFGSYPYPPNFLFKTVHEYVLVFAKPPSKQTRGPKVKPFRQLMTVSDDEPRAAQASENGDNLRPGGRKARGS